MEQIISEKEQWIELFCEFLYSVGIPIKEKEFKGTTFLPGLKIENGCLIINRKTLLYPGDILHEAGHIAVTTTAERNTLNENVTDNRPGSEGEELSAMLWSYAACIHMEIDPEIVFHKDGYKGDSEWILSNYEEKNYIGLPLLVWMGLASHENNENGFPKMIKWLRD